MLKFILFIFVASLSVSLLNAKPGRQDNEPKKDKPAPKLPDMTMTSNWGVVTQNGNVLKIEGHPHWSAVGEILKSGKVSLVWELLSDGRYAPGFYEWDGKQLNGRWNYADRVSVEDDGSLTGVTNADTIRKVVMPAPEIQ
jgi:hypothetical protein